MTVSTTLALPSAVLTGPSTAPSWQVPVAYVGDAWFELTAIQGSAESGAAPFARYFANTTVLVLMVRPDFPAKDVKGFVAYAKTQPGKLSAGYGSSSSQISISMLNKMAGLDTLSIPYKGIPLAVNDVVGRWLLAYPALVWAYLLLLRAIDATRPSATALWALAAGLTAGLAAALKATILLPVGWAREIIHRLTKAPQLVCDPFLGSGTTGVAAATGRDA
mgnify:CR=1 FL=1